MKSKIFIALTVVILLVLGNGYIPTNAGSNCLGWNQHDADAGKTKNISPACGITTSTLELSYKIQMDVSTGLPNSWVYSYGDKLIFQERTLHCYDINSGKKLWDQKAKMFKQINGTFTTIINDSIFYGTMFGVRAVNLKNGTTKFDISYPRTTNTFLAIGAHPKTMLYNGQIYVSSGGKIFKLDPKTRKSAEVYDTGVDLKKAFPFELLIGGDKYIFDNDTTIDIVDMKNTRSKKSYRYKNAYVRDMACNDKYAFIEFQNTDTYNSEVVCIEINSGKKKWSFDYQSTISGFVISEDIVIYTTTDGKVHCKQQDSGDEVWTKSIGNSARDPILCGNGLFVNTGVHFGDDSKVFRLDAETGDTTWEYELAGAVELNMILAENRLIVISRQMTELGRSYLYCFEKGKIGKPAEIVIDPEEVKTAVDDSIKVNVTVYDENKTKIPDAKLTFESSDTDICTVDKNGFIKAIGVGECKIKVTCNRINKEVDVKVYENTFPEVIESEINFGVVDFKEMIKQTLTIKMIL